MHEFDEAVLQCFLDNQEQLFSKTVMSLRLVVLAGSLRLRTIC